MRPAASLLLCIGVAAACQGVPARARAQAAPRSCVVRIDSTGREALFIRVATPTGSDYQAFAGGGVYGHCQDDPTTTMQADSLAWYPNTNEARFLRNVHFRDSSMTLEADRLTYFVRQERLYAEGNVFTRNLRTGSDLRGPNLDYRRSRPGVRDTAEMFATRRPTIRFFAARDSVRGAGADGDSAEPFVIVADRARMRGNDQMWAGGQVTVDRSDLAARGDSAALDLGADQGVLLGGPPTVEGKGDSEYRLSGTRIAFGLTPQHELRQVLASGEADATGPDWSMRADTLDLALDSGKVQRTQAWGRTRRPYAVSGTYTIVADSLDMLMPAQVMREVWAFGNGRATTRPDSTVLEDDWMTGDTLHAVFAERDAGAADSAGARKQELRSLTSLGAARSLYHVVDEQRRDQLPGINYSRGRRIAIAMREGKVATVDVVGQVDGVYLEPVPRRPAGADSAATTVPVPADTARAVPLPGDSLPPTPAGPAAPDSARARPRPDSLPPRPRRPTIPPERRS